MSIPPVRRLPRDAETLAGRGTPSRGAGGPAARAGLAGDQTGIAPTSADMPGARSNSAGQIDSRAAGVALRQARDVAEQVAGHLEQLIGARKSLRSVQQLVEQLRDVAVVGLDRTLAPSNRVALQRQVDLTLNDIDGLASSTPLDAQATGLPISAPAAGAAGGTISRSFAAIGTAALGIANLGVRSPDESYGTMRLLDRALTRLDSTSASLVGATARFAQALGQLTSPAQTATGEPALTSPTAALTSAMLTSQQLLTRPQDAAAAQDAPTPAQARSLLG